MPQVPLAGFSVSLAHDKTLSSYHLKQAPADMNLMPDLIGNNTLPLHTQARIHTHCCCEQLPAARGNLAQQTGPGGRALKNTLNFTCSFKRSINKQDLSLMLP